MNLSKPTTGITGVIKMMTTASKKLFNFGSCLKPQIKGKENTERIKDFSVVKSEKTVKNGLKESFKELTISD
jgi:hypothetical protein